MLDVHLVVLHWYGTKGSTIACGGSGSSGGGDGGGSSGRMVTCLPAAYPGPTPPQACLHELIVQHGVGVAAGGLQELVQALGRAEQTGPNKIRAS